jgi:hypothetical protein
MLRSAGGRLYLMTALPWLSLAAKALATALIVVTASTAAEALGPVWGAIIASLPVSAGPAYVFLAMQHGPAFVAASALNSAAANAATGLLLTTYARLAGRMSPWRGLTLAVAIWLAASIALQQVTWTTGLAAALNVVVYGLGMTFVSRHKTADAVPAGPLRRRWFDLPLRAASVAAFVSTVVAVSAELGPAATGIAAVFPVSLISLIVILRHRLGGPSTTRLAANALPPMLGFGFMLLLLHLAIRPFGITPALLLALAFSVLWSAISLWRQTGGGKALASRGLTSSGGGPTPG